MSCSQTHVSGEGKNVLPATYLAPQPEQPLHKLVINLQPLGWHSCLPCFRCFPLDEMSFALDVLLSRSLLGEPR